jgi:hypothetical protein
MSFRPNLLSLLQDNHWPMLKRLILSNFSVSQTGNIEDDPIDGPIEPFSSFFARHEQLVCVFVDQLGAIVSESLRPGALPNLRSLQFRQDLLPLSFIPTDMRNRLSFLAVDISQHDMGLIGKMKNLTRLWINTTQAPPVINMLVEAAPQLHRLRFRTPHGLEVCPFHLTPEVNAKHTVYVRQYIVYAEPLSHLTALTHLYIHPINRHDQLKPHTVAEQLAIVPRLKYISQSAVSTLGIEINRNASGGYSSYNDCRLLAGNDARDSWGDGPVDLFNSPDYL